MTSCVDKGSLPTRRVAVFCEALGLSAETGTRRFMVEILRRLPRLLGDDFSITLVAASDDAAKKMAHLLPTLRPTIAVVRLRRWSSRFLWLLGVRSLASAIGRHDVYLSGWHWPFGRSDRPFICIVHDVAPAAWHAQGWRRLKVSIYRWVYFAGLRAGLRRASVAVFVSGDTRRRAQSMGFDVSKAVVIHHGVDLEKFSTPTPLPERWAGLFPRDAPVLLAVGPHVPPKNHRRLLGAFASHVLPVEPRAVLVLAGRHGEVTDALLAESNRLGLRNQVLLPGRLTEEELVAVLQRAMVFVCPSLEEGFGLPILEAFAAGTAVACSNAGALPEIAGSAVEYFSPTDTDEMGSVLARLVMDPSRRRQLQRLGRERCRQFSWDAAAEAYAAVIRQVSASMG